MSKRAGLIVCMLSMSFGLFGDQGPDLAGQLWATTNLWGGAAAMTRYHCVIVPGLLAKMQADSRYDETLAGWYCAVARADESLEAGDRWCVLKGEMLHRYAHLPPVAASTNAWLAAADFLGRLRSARAADAGGGTAVTHRLLSAAELAAFNDIAEQKEAFYRRRNIAEAADRIEPLMLNALTNAFPVALLDTLDSETRQAMLSNIVERASLTEEESAVLRGISEAQ